MTGMLQTLFRLEKDEIRPAGMVFLITFLWGTSQMFSYSAANAIFLNVYGASFLSYTFIFNAVLIPLTGFAMIKASEKFSFRQYFTGTLVFFTLALFLFFTLLTFTKLKWPAMIFLLWLDIEYTVSSVLFMALLNKLFNIRQSKRVFGPAGLGTDLSYVIMGLVISLIVNFTGVLNLTVFAVVFDFISIFVFYRIYVTFPDKIKKTSIIFREEQESHEKTTLTKLFRSPFVALIIALGSIFSMCLCFGTNLYLGETQQYLKDENKVASFIALFYSFSSFILLFIKGFAASRVIKNFGMTVSLMLSPFLTGLSALVFIVLLKFPFPPLLFFGLAVNIYLIQNVFGTSVHKSAYFSLIQSLPADETDRVINLSETIVPNLLNGIAGAILLVMMQVFKAGSRELGIGILVIAAVWLLISLLAGKEYRRNLRSILKNRFDEEMEIDLDRPEILKSLNAGLKSSYPQEAVYSMEMLEKSGISGLKDRVRELALSGNPDVRKKVFGIFEKYGSPEDLVFLAARLAGEKVPENRAVLLCAIAGASGDGEIEMIENYMRDQDKTVSIGAFTALIRYCGIEGVMKAGSELLVMAKSEESQGRQFAAEIIGNVGYPNLYNLLLPLLSDENPDVRKKAFEAAGKIRNPKLVPFMVRELKNAALRSTVMQGLAGFSSTAFPAMEDIYQTDPANRKLIAYLYGRIKGEDAVRNLFRKLHESDRDVLTEILNSLELCSFKLERKDLEQFENILDKMIDFGVLLKAALADLNHAEDSGILADALENEIRKNRLRIFSLISILHPDSNIRDIRFNYFFGQTEEKKALAVELLDNILPKKHQLSVMGLLEDSGGLPEKIRHKYPHQNLGFEERLDEIIRDKENWQNVWLRSLVYFTKLNKIESEGERKAFLLNMVRNENMQVPELILPYRKQDGESGLTLIDTVLFIRKSGIFSGIEDESLVEIAKCMKVVRLAENSRIFNKNDTGAELYLIASGRVLIHDGGRTIAELSDGEIFGELSAFSPEKRSADATAKTGTALFSISQADIFCIVDDRIEAAIDIIGILCGRLRKTLAEGGWKQAGTADKALPENAGSPGRNLSTVEKMLVLKTVSIFSGIPDNILDDLAALARESIISKGLVLFRKGDAGTSMYIIVSGKMRVHDREETIAILGGREIIGEFAALSSESRTADVTALEDSVLLKITQESVYAIMWDQRDTAKEFIKVLAERLRGMI